VLKQVASESLGKYRNFDVNYIDCPITASRLESVDRFDTTVCG